MEGADRKVMWAQRQRCRCCRYSLLDVLIDLFADSSLCESPLRAKPTVASVTGGAPFQVKKMEPDELKRSLAQLAREGYL